MKTIIWAIVILIVVAGVALECRYAFIVDLPIVAKIDRFTGDVWIVNSGEWRKVQEFKPDAVTSAGKVVSAIPAKAK